jgi:hypothetical protein
MIGIKLGFRGGRARSAADIAAANINSLSPAWWILGDSLSDRSPNARHATNIVGAEPAAIVDGTDSALQFTGTDGINVSRVGISGSTGFTFWMAFRPDAVSGTVYPFSIGALNFAMMWVGTAPRIAVASSGNYVQWGALVAGTRYMMLCRFDGAAGTNTTKCRVRLANVEQSLSSVGTIPTSIGNTAGGTIGRRSDATGPAAITVYSAGVIPSVLSDANCDFFDAQMRTILGWYP